MTDDFAKAKRRVSDKFLGKSAVHGVGIHADAVDTIAVYRERASDETSAETEAIAESIRQEASPFNVEIFHEEGTAVHAALAAAADENLGAAVPFAKTAPADEGVSAAVAPPEHDDLSESHGQSDGTKTTEMPDGETSTKD